MLCAGKCHALVARRPAGVLQGRSTPFPRPIGHPTDLAALPEVSAPLLAEHFAHLVGLEASRAARPRFLTDWLFSSPFNISPTHILALSAATTMPALAPCHRPSPAALAAGATRPVQARSQKALQQRWQHQLAAARQAAGLRRCQTAAEKEGGTAQQQQQQEPQVPDSPPAPSQPQRQQPTAESSGSQAAAQVGALRSGHCALQLRLSPPCPAVVSNWPMNQILSQSIICRWMSCPLQAETMSVEEIQQRAALFRQQKAAEEAKKQGGLVEVRLAQPAAIPIRLHAWLSLRFHVMHCLQPSQACQAAIPTPCTTACWQFGRAQLLPGRGPWHTPTATSPSRARPRLPKATSTSLPCPALPAWRAGSAGGGGPHQVAQPRRRSAQHPARHRHCGGHLRAAD